MAFILGCGATHFTGYFLSTESDVRVYTLWFTSFISSVTAIALFWVIPKVLRWVMQFQQMHMNELKSRDALNQAMSEAAQANINKEEFMAFLCHEIRNPLHAIAANIDFLLAAPRLDEELKSWVDAIDGSTRMICSLVDDVLNISRLHQGRMEFETLPFNVVNECTKLIGDIRARVSKKPIKLSTVVGDNIPQRIFIDGIRLKQVLMNLLSNAAKFTFSGSITLSITCTHECPPSPSSFVVTSSRKPLLDYSTFRHQGSKPQFRSIDEDEEVKSFSTDSTNPKYVWIKFQVTDTGIGIRPESLKTLFQPYSQAKLSTYREYGGSGLGLAISSRIVQVLGGTLSVTSELGVGSSFSVLIKAVDCNAESQSVIPIDVPLLPGLRILVVDDNATNRKILAKILTNMGHVVDLAADGLQALEMVRKIPEQYRVIFMDISMPVMDGYNSAQHMRAIGIDTPIIALTANASQEDREKALSSGMTDFATKPIRKPEILKLIQQSVFPTRSLSEPVLLS